MELSQYKFPTVTKVDLAFPTFGAPKELLEEAQSRDLKKGLEKFDEVFYKGGKMVFKKDVKGSWKEAMWHFCKVFIRSWEPKHEHKRIICAMIFEECLEL